MLQAPLLPHKFAEILCTDIFIARSDRQRRKIDTSDIDDSIRDRGVFQPIVVDRPLSSDDTTLPWKLIMGERRLTSSIKVGRTHIPARLADTLTKQERKLIELEENVKRQALPWQDEVRAIEDIHKILSELYKDWDASKTGEYIGLTKGPIAVALRVARDLNNPRIAGADGIRPAYNILSRLDERRNTDIINSIVESGISAFAMPAPAPIPVTTTDIVTGITTITIPEPIHLPVPVESILNLDFLLWAPQYAGPKFNFIHMDPPYGINVFGGNMSGRKSHDTYSDDKEVYWTILRCLCVNLDRLLTPSAHFMLWFSMDYYTETLEFFRVNAPSLNFSPFPLYWIKSDSVGMLPDPKRGPRRIVETALVASREDHLIVRPVNNAYSAPTDKAYHPSTKPEPMLRHFFQMFVDETTRLLDPTCGSGSALRAAESLGADNVLGLERNPIHYEAAKLALRSFRNLRKASV